MGSHGLSQLIFQRPSTTLESLSKAFRHYLWKSLWIDLHIELSTFGSVTNLCILSPNTESYLRFAYPRLKTPLPDITMSLHYVSAVLPIARDGHLRRNTLVNQGCLPFTKTIRLEISGINIKHLNATSRERESQKVYPCQLERLKRAEK